ncbi:MAG: DUF4126 domain-containing protein [Anaerolineales bacterium]|nr:DUF4126 domain-containing protein [Anaerolineales bacterium]
MEELLGLFIGIGLSATCGFRVFVPLFGMSIAHHAGALSFSSGFDWIGSWPATIAFGIAMVIEIAAYYIPWVDNLLDTIATPAAVVAGTIVTASMVGDVSPFLRWSLAIIAGGGIAAIVQGSSVLVRGASTVSTAGLANPVVSTGELGASILGTLISIILPTFAVILVVVLLAFLLRRFIKPSSSIS